MQSKYPYDDVLNKKRGTTFHKRLHMLYCWCMIRYACTFKISCFPWSGQIYPKGTISEIYSQPEPRNCLPPLCKRNPALEHNWICFQTPPTFLCFSISFLLMSWWRGGRKFGGSGREYISLIVHVPSVSSYSLSNSDETLKWYLHKIQFY